LYFFYFSEMALRLYARLTSPGEVNHIPARLVSDIGSLGCGSFTGRFFRRLVFSAASVIFASTHSA
jgi:hypothetical protein